MPPTHTSTVAAIVVTNSSVTLAVTPARQPDRCCTGACAYRPERVAWLMSQIETLAQSGYTPAEAIISVMSDDNIPGGSFGPGMRRGLDDVADISRAIKAGKRNPVAIARFLCPWSEDDDAD